jgi:phytoene synthase
MSATPKILEETYLNRALPRGGVRYWTHFFAARAQKDSLLGIYALQAEWSALLDPATESEVAQLKLHWWRGELDRLQCGQGAHPISVFLSALPYAHPSLFAQLAAVLEAAGAELGGVPLEHDAELDAHAAALLATPLEVAAQLGGEPSSDALTRATRALAVGEYLARALRNYRREVNRGRMPFPVAGLLALNVDNADLAAAAPGPALGAYLADQRRRAGTAFAAVPQLLAGSRGSLRHLAVAARLGSAHLAGQPSSRLASLKDMLMAWRAAARAA